MAMFDDPKKELQRLQEQLLQDEEWFERELDSAKRMIGENPGKKANNPASPRAGVPRSAAEPQPKRPVRVTVPEQEEPEEPEPPKKGIRGLVILAVLETLGIVGIVAYWMLVLLK